MSFSLRPYTPPDFTQPFLADAPDVCFQPAPFDGVAPEQYHAMSIFPEYFKVNGTWLLAEESRMDCVAVYENGKIIVREFRLLKKGDLIAVGRTEDGSDGIYVHANGSTACGSAHLILNAPVATTLFFNYSGSANATDGEFNLTILKLRRFA